MSGSIIRIKRSAVPGKQPTVSDLQTGELALNTFDAELYVKRVRAGIGTDIVRIGSGVTVTNVLYVTQDGKDTNSGKKLGDAKATIKGAVADSAEGTVIKISAGTYIEDNPIVVPNQVSIVGDSLREVTVIPRNTADLFHVGNGNYIAEMSYLPYEGQSNPNAIFAFDPNDRRYINQSPYIQNCTNFIPDSIGLRVDGSKALGPLKSMVLDSYTQYNPNGVGASMTNEGYTQLVSLFTICNNVSVFCGTGAACDLTNSNSSFGNYALIADGVGPLKYKGYLTKDISEGSDEFSASITTPTLKIYDAVWNNATGVLTAYTETAHEFQVGMDVNLNNLAFTCTDQPSLLNVYDAIYDNVSGIATITTDQEHGLVVGYGVTISGLGFTCPSGPGIVTYPSGNLGYVFEVTEVGTTTSFAVNVGTSTLPHTYVSGGTVLSFDEYYIIDGSVTNAIYDNTTGIATITLASNHNFRVGFAAEVIGLGFTCPSGPGIVTYPSGNLGYVFRVDEVVNDNTFAVNVGTSTLPHTYDSGGTVNSVGRAYPSGKYDYTFRVESVAPGRYLDASASILSNRKEIQDKSLAAIALNHPDFYFPGDDQTNSRSRYYDAYRLIQQNRREIIDKSLASIAIGYPNFYFPGDDQTNSRSRYYDAYRLIQNNKQYIIDTSWDNTVATYPGISTTQETCKRDLGFFIDAVTTDVFTGGNKYARDFTLQYFDNAGNPISNGLIGEEVESVYAFNQARDLMKLAITNQLAYNEPDITGDPNPGGYPPPYGTPGNTSNNTNLASCFDVQTNIDNLVGIITTVVGLGTTASLSGFSENLGISTTLKCARDLGYLVDAISTDVFTGGNKYSRDFTKQYFDANGDLTSNGLEGEVNESVYSFIRVGSFAKKAITNQLNIKDVGISSGPATYGGPGIAITVYESGNGDACADVQTNIDNLIGIVTTTIGTVNINFLDSFNENSGSFDDGMTKCYRDIGYIIDAVALDVRDFTNQNIVEATQSYFTEGGQLTENGLLGETQESITAFNAIRDYSKLAINNQLNNKNFDLIADPLTGSNNDPESCTDVKDNIDTLISILTTSIQNENLNSLPSVSYASTVFSLNTGISTLSHTYNKGGITKINISRPFDGQVVYFDKLYYEVSKIKLEESGSGYINVPTITFDSPSTDWGITAQAVAQLDNDGKIASVELVSSGRGYTTLPRVIVESNDVGITTAKVSIELTPKYYFILNSTEISSGVTTSIVNDNLPYDVGVGTAVYFYKQSRVLASGHSLEYIGSGINIANAVPFNGGITIQDNETESIDGGLVVFTSTDQSGNFRIGDGVIVNQATGTISGNFYSKSLFSTITPFILALGGE